MRQHARQRGTAMVETVMILPMIALVLLMLLYFGRGVVRVQRAQVMDRYEAWHGVAAAPGPGADNATNNAQMNQLFMGDRAETIEYYQNGAFPSEAADRLVSYAFALSDATGNLVARQFSRGQHGRTVHFSTDHPPGNVIVEQYEGQILHGHTRLGNDWAYVNGWNVQSDDDLSFGRWERAGPYGPSIMASSRDVFYSEFDESLAALDTPMANSVRNIYLAQPGYIGPDVRF